MPSDVNRCAVLGGAGFLGSHLTEALIDRGHEVRVFDKTGANLENLAGLAGSFEFQGGDLVNEVDLEKAVAGVDTVYHLISTTLPASSNRNPIYDVESNLLGTLRLLHISLAAGVSRVTGERTVGFLGDSPFFHSGMPALVNAIKEDVSIVVVVLDNQVTAMTGFQESPSVKATEGMTNPPVGLLHATLLALLAMSVRSSLR